MGHEPKSREGFVGGKKNMRMCRKYTQKKFLRLSTNSSLCLKLTQHLQHSWSQWMSMQTAYANNSSFHFWSKESQRSDRITEKVNIWIWKLSFLMKIIMILMVSTFALNQGVYSKLSLEYFKLFSSKIIIRLHTNSLQDEANSLHLGGSSLTI